jgi:bifunctional non-homologous end joining protein LigD
MKQEVSPALSKILNKCPKCSMPGNIAPMALTLAHEPFNDKQWQFEIKWNGFRIFLHAETTISIRDFLLLRQSLSK